MEARDGSIGKVDKATYDVGSSYLVVDTGPWIFGHKVILPAGVISSIDTASEKVHVDRTKDEIKAAPHLDDADFEGPRRDELGAYYGVGGNIRRLRGFAHQVGRIWRKWLSRRDRQSVVTWTRFNELFKRHPLPSAKIVHGYAAASESHS